MFGTTLKLSITISLANCTTTTLSMRHGPLQVQVWASLSQSQPTSQLFLSWCSFQNKAQGKSWEIHPSNKGYIPIASSFMVSSDKKLRGQMVQDSWRGGNPGCCSHSYSIRKSTGQPMQWRRNRRGYYGGEKRGTEKKCFSPCLLLQVQAGRRKCVSSAALCTAL